MIERRVLVIFKEDIDKEVIENFYKGLDLLRQNTKYLKLFEIKHFQRSFFEEKLSQHVANVIYPHLMTVWQFESKQHLDLFISCDFHQHVAQQYFKPAVHQRIVFNC